MKAFTDYETTREYTDTVKLPAGAYEVKIKRAEDSDKALCILFDISDGEYKNYYINKFQSDKKQYENAKFKGVLRLWYSDGSESDEKKKRRMKTVLKLIKEENKLNVDFSKEWDGAALKDAVIGMIFQDCEYDYKGYRGFSAQPYGVISLSDLKEGRYQIPKPKYLQTDTADARTDSLGDLPVDDNDDLPF